MTDIEKAVFKDLYNLVVANQYSNKTEIRYSEVTSDTLYHCAHCHAEYGLDHMSDCPIGTTLAKAEKILANEELI